MIRDAQQMSCYFAKMKGLRHLYNIYITAGKFGETG